MALKATDDPTAPLWRPRWARQGAGGRRSGPIKGGVAALVNYLHELVEGGIAQPAPPTLTAYHEPAGAGSNVM